MPGLPRIAAQRRQGGVGAAQLEALAAEIAWRATPGGCDRKHSVKASDPWPCRCESLTKVPDTAPGPSWQRWPGRT